MYYIVTENNPPIVQQFTFKTPKYINYFFLILNKKIKKRACQRAEWCMKFAPKWEIFFETQNNYRNMHVLMTVMCCTVALASILEYYTLFIHTILYYIICYSLVCMWGYYEPKIFNLRESSSVRLVRHTENSRHLVCYASCIL
jgi:hypothetical protein